MFELAKELFNLGLIHLYTTHNSMLFSVPTSENQIKLTTACEGNIIGTWTLQDSDGDDLTMGFITLKDKPQSLAKYLVTKAK